MAERYETRLRRVFGREPTQTEVERARRYGKRNSRYSRVTDEALARLADAQIAADDEQRRKWQVEHEAERAARREERTKASGFRVVELVGWREAFGIAPKKGREGGGSGYVCVSCDVEADKENNKPECHRCSDWSPCGTECTFSGVTCPKCGKHADSDELPYA